MLNHTYTSVKNANVVDCGKKEKIPSQPFPLLRDNYLGEYRTELDKKKVLANLGIATDLSLEWEFIKGDIGRSESLMKELDSRTKYTSILDPKISTVIEGLQYIETIIGGEEDAEEAQNKRLDDLEKSASDLLQSLNDLNTYIKETVDVDIDTLEKNFSEISKKVENITELIQVSTKEGNALTLITGEENSGLYVPDLSKYVTDATSNIEKLQEDVKTINNSLEDFVTKEELGGGNFDFVDLKDFDSYKEQNNEKISTIEQDLAKTVKTDEDGHVDTLYVNTISKNNDDGNIKITDSFEVESGIPLDVRFVVENLEKLLTLPVKVCYEGMGVIVNSLSSLYILRKPKEGVSLTQEYISNIYNWKCPEDLVTVALTREQYNNLEEINPNVFYYIYEDEIKHTTEPKRIEYASEEEFYIAWQEWVDSLKTLSQEYMSASWGVDIENKLGKKASNESVNLLLLEINNLKGGGSGITLESLSTDISNLQKSDEDFKKLVDEVLVKEEDSESGRLVNVEQEMSNVKNSLNNYVTKDYIQDASNEFIFVKNDIYLLDLQQLKQDLATELTTNKVITNNILLDNKTLGIVDDKLQFNSSLIAFKEDIPVLTVISQTEYDNLQEINEETYYYTYDSEVILATKADLKGVTDSINALIAKLLERIQVLEDALSKYHSETEE